MIDRPANQTEGVQITPEMVQAGASVLWELDGEVSKEVLAREVYLAMAHEAPCRTVEPSSPRTK